MSYGLSSAGYDVRLKRGVYLKPGQFRLGSTLERFSMPNDVLAIVHDKSTWARRGIALQNTVIEPGWRGWLTVEITNHGEEEVRIPAGAPIAQIVFHKLLEATQQPYAGKYQDQEDMPVEARLEKGA